METKTCAKCAETKPITEFHRSDAVRGYLRPDCKVCDRDKARRYYQEHPEYAERVKAGQRAKRVRSASVAGEKREPQTPEEKRAKRAAYMRDYIATHPEQREKANARTREWFKAHPENYSQRRDYIIQWHRDNPVPGDRKRRNQMRSLYGLCPDEYKRMLDAQDNKCALCRQEYAGRKKKAWKWQIGTLSIDHCHKTNRVRGLLCHPCNARLGSLEALRDAIGLQRVFDYLGWSGDVLNEPAPEASPPPVV